ncbi:MAG: hypothetical protein IPQ19_07875 [Bacteroidetes bacterium]|nr:hypothetical protein [Bacteroidota bacterium]
MQAHYHWKANDFILLCTDGFERLGTMKVVKLMNSYENEVYKMAEEMEENAVCYRMIIIQPH